MNDCVQDFKSHPQYLVLLIALLDHQKRKETCCCIEFTLCLALMTHVIVNMNFLRHHHNPTKLTSMFHKSIFLPSTPQQTSCHL